MPAKWLKNGEEITPEDGYKITVDGKQHKLVIPDVTLDHEAEYTVVIDDKSSSANLTVEGKFSVVMENCLLFSIYIFL